MDFNSLLKNKPLLFGIIGGVVVVVALIVVLLIPKGQDSASKKIDDKPIDQDVQLLTTDNQGKAIEIQSLLAQQGINVQREDEGQKSKLMLMKEDHITLAQRDMALLAVVRSGLMDKNVGLEVFDKGDFTSSREDKRIRLARAINGELSRLIRKIPPIQDASVFISLPQQQTLFASEEKPITATVQITMPSPGSQDQNGHDVEDKLDHEKVRAVTNLLMGSVQGLEAKNISITDTNGNVYSSVMSPEDDMMTMLEENDKYMKNKVMAQLDRLLGKGNYVVTVSTYLREAPEQLSKTIYNPKSKSVLSEQRFAESLGDKSAETSRLSSAVSSFLPGNLPGSPNSSSNRSYSRAAAEMQYGVGKTEIAEERKPGMMEEISIAVTMDKGAFPSSMNEDDFKNLVASAASPKADPTNVKIAYADMNSPVLSADQPAHLPKPEESGNPWWTVAARLGAALITGLIFIANKVKDEANKQQKEIDTLYEKTELQQRQIREAQERAAQIQTAQDEMKTSISSRPESPALPENLQQTISTLKNSVEENSDEDEIALQLKSWIESTG